MINLKDENEPQGETVRQTIERVARELGVFGTTPTNNITHSPQSPTQQPTALSSSPNYFATATNNWQIQPTTAAPQNSNTFGGTSQSNQPAGFTPSPIQPTNQTAAAMANQPGQPSPVMQAIYRYLANTYGQQNVQIPTVQKQSLSTQSLINPWYRKTYDKVQNEATKLHDEPLYDKYKHSVVSCIGAQDGLYGAAVTSAMGVGKEIMDISRKIPQQWNGKQDYGGYLSILGDSFEDLVADAKGIYKGYKNKDDDCYYMMKSFYDPYKNK